MEPGADIQHSTSDNRRLIYAFLGSLLIHALLLSLAFGGDGLWPDFALPWHHRRVEVPDLRVVLPPQVTGADPAPSVIEPPHATRPAPAASTARTSSAFDAAISRSTAPAVGSSPELSAPANAEAPAITDAAPVEPLPLARLPGPLTAVPLRAPPVIALSQIDADTWVIPELSPIPTPIAAAPALALADAELTLPAERGDRARVDVAEKRSQRAVVPPEPPLSRHEDQADVLESDSAAQEPIAQDTARSARAANNAEVAQRVAQEETARKEAERKEIERKETERKEAERKETERKETERKEVERKEVERKEVERKEAERKEAERKEVERKEAERKETERKEIERKETERKETERKEAERKEAERKETERKEAERRETERKEAERNEAATRREAALRAIGRQLDEEAARREAASRALPSSSGARRYKLWGQTDPNAELVRYALVWARKFETNMTFDLVRDALKQRHRDPVVTVAIRSDGSVESVTFEMSSGVQALDDAIRRVVESQRPYQPFPPSLASEYDVIEIRRTWYFDVAIRLY